MASESLSCRAQEECAGRAERGNRKIDKDTSDIERGGLGGVVIGGVIINLSMMGLNKFREWGVIRQNTNDLRLRLPLRGGPKKVSVPRQRSVYRPAEQGLRRSRRVMDNGCIYVSAVIFWRGCKQHRFLLSLYQPRQRMGGDAVVQNRKPVRAEEASYSVSGEGGGKKGSWRNF